MRARIYAWSAAALVGAVALRWLLNPLMGGNLPLVTLFGAVAAGVWIGGYRAAVPVCILGYLACFYLFMEPRGTFAVPGIADVTGLLAYLFTCALIIAFGEALRGERSRANAGQEILRVTLRSIGDAVITTDTNGCVTYLNEVAESLTGWAQADATRQPLDQVFRIINEESRRPVENPATKALRQGVVVGLANHTLLIRKDGVELPIDDSAAPIRDEHGHVSGCVLIFRDVSAQRSLERSRADQLESARFLAAIVESSDDAIISKSLDGIIQSWNIAAERLFGYTSEQAVGRHISLVIPPDRIAEEDRIIASLRAGRRIEHFETERVRSDGRRVMVSLTISPIRDQVGRIVGASKIVRDITERKQVEAERQKFVTLVESSTDFIGMSDLQGKPFFVNRAGLEMVGLESVEQASQTPIAEFFFPEDRDRIVNEFLPEVRTHGHGELEVRFRHFKSGRALWMAYKVLLLKDAAGQPIGYATVSQDISGRKLLEDELRKLATNLSEADRRKDEFLATLAHELRNPLAPVCNMLEVWKRADGDREVRGRVRETMERQLGQMVRLVDDLLDLNRITHNRLELRQSEVELASVINQAVEASRPFIDSAGHELQVNLPAKPLYLFADAARLAQVFGNLLNNSSKYTNRGGKISISAERAGGDVVVSVKDNGIGIPPDKLGSIFEMFAQVDSSLERAQSGLGIGLTLVRRLVQMHGGSIEAKSQGRGHGSEFVLRLPALVVEASENTHERAAAEPPPSRRILVVDDNTDSAVSLAMLLETANNETHTAHDGLSAVEAVKKYRPEVVLLDIGLPKMSGHEVCRRIRELPGGKEIVIIALTGWGQEEDKRMSQEAGFDGHLVKPVDYDILLELLRTLVPARARPVGVPGTGKAAPSMPR